MTKKTCSRKCKHWIPHEGIALHFCSREVGTIQLAKKGEHCDQFEPMDKQRGERI